LWFCKYSNGLKLQKSCFTGIPSLEWELFKPAPGNKHGKYSAVPVRYTYINPIVTLVLVWFIITTTFGFFSEKGLTFEKIRQFHRSLRHKIWILKMKSCRAV
jgi:hypothetical protein